MRTCEPKGLFWYDFLMTLKKIVWNSARTTGNPVYPHGGSSLFFSVSVKVLPVTPLLSGGFVHRAFCAYFYWVAYGKPSRGLRLVCLFYLFYFYLFFFSVSAKILPVTPLVSGVFVHRAFCAYFLRIERVVELRRFLWWTQ